MCIIYITIIFQLNDLNLFLKLYYSSSNFDFYYYEYYNLIQSQCFSRGKESYESILTLA